MNIKFHLCCFPQAFVEDPDNPPVVIAHVLLPGQQDRQMATGLKLLKGSVHQFGTALSDNAMLNAGLGPRLRIPVGESAGYSVAPSIFITEDGQEMDIAGHNKLTIFMLFLSI